MNDDSVAIHRILVPLDGSSRAESVASHVEALAKATGAKLTFVQVVEPSSRAEVVHDDQLVGPSSDTSELGAARRYLERWAEHELERGLQADTLLMRGVAVDAITKALETTSADVLAMTSRGKGRLEHAIFGNVVLGVLNRVTRPVLLVPPGSSWSLTSSGRILLPLDGTQRAEAVLAHAEFLARAFDARLLLLRVVRTGHETTVFEDVENDIEERKLDKGLFSRLGRHQEVERIREAQAYLRDCRAALRAKGLQADAVLTHGRPVDSIIDIARRDDVDLVAMTNQVRTGLASILYGSVASGLLARIDCPVFVVPTGDPAPKNFA